MHFLLLQRNGMNIPEESMQYLDTIDIPWWSGYNNTAVVPGQPLPPGSPPFPSVRIRMDFTQPNIVGDFVYHCHILEHEDKGMMQIIRVLPCEAGNTCTPTYTPADGDGDGTNPLWVGIGILLGLCLVLFYIGLTIDMRDFKAFFGLSSNNNIKNETATTSASALGNATVIPSNSTISGSYALVVGSTAQEDQHSAIEV